MTQISSQINFQLFWTKPARRGGRPKSRFLRLQVVPFGKMVKIQLLHMDPKSTPNEFLSAQNVFRDVFYPRECVWGEIGEKKFSTIFGSYWTLTKWPTKIGDFGTFSTFFNTRQGKALYGVIWGQKSEFLCQKIFWSRSDAPTTKLILRWTHFIRISHEKSNQKNQIVCLGSLDSSKWFLSAKIEFRGQNYP